MNNGRMWTVVSPNIGVPVFFIALAVTSLLIHYLVLTTTSYFGDYWKGSSMAAISAPVESVAKANIPTEVD